LEKVNWDEQWQLFAEGYKEGKAHINLSKYGVNQTFPLLPGPGFGDCSHETTRLCLELLSPRIHSQSMLDIGCGSGILSIGAFYMGATSIYGVDIDPDAILHSKKNLNLNPTELITFSTTPTNKLFDVACMNMIFQDQLAAMSFPYQAKTWITSGILESQKEAYLTQTQKWGWTLYQMKRRGNWLGFVFKSNYKK
jgi:ribosomal protein L11 methyltransferase